MSERDNRSLCSALRRLRFMAVLLCAVIATSMAAQLVVWSLAAFTDMRYGEPEASGERPLIVKPKRRGPSSRNRSRFGGRRPTIEEPDDDDRREPRSVGAIDGWFMKAIGISRGTGLLAALTICPVLAIGVVLTVPVGANKADRAVTAMTWSLLLVLLALPLSGWLGLPWQDGTLARYGPMMEAVEAARDDGFSVLFYVRFLVLPGVSFVGFILIAAKFSAAVRVVLYKANAAGLDPALESEASGLQATSLHGGGRSSGALTQAMKPKKKAKPASSLSKVSAGQVPRRLI